jgi:hypothetical protein
MIFDKAATSIAALEIGMDSVNVKRALKDAENAAKVISMALFRIGIAMDA